MNKRRKSHTPHPCFPSPFSCSFLPVSAPSCRPLPGLALLGSSCNLHQPTKIAKKYSPIFIHELCFCPFCEQHWLMEEHPLSLHFNSQKELRQHTSISLYNHDKRLGWCTPIFSSFHCLVKVWLLLLLHLKDGDSLSLYFE